MTRPLIFLLIGLACHCLSGCGSSGNYRITLRDGREFIAASKPDLQSKTGYYRYRNFQGRDALIRADEVLMIQRES